MKKVGIVTFHRATNYGAVLQAYALQQQMKKDGYSCEIVDIRNDRVDLHYRRIVPRFASTGAVLKDIRKYLSGWWHILDKIKRQFVFDAFLKKNMNLSNPCGNIEELKAISGDYDFFLCGSDQVWNLGSNGKNSAYFLDFTDPAKRNSYAASIGTAHIEDEYLSEYKRFLEGFNRISVREKESVSEIKKACGKDATWVLDPTLLLTNKEWEACTEAIDVPSKYVLVYMLYDVANEAFIEFIDRIATDKDLSVVYIGKNKRIKIKDKVEVFPTPSQWVWLFLNASYVITNSYHGTVFSINFGKEFYTGLLVPDTRPANVRMRGILEYLGLNDRLINYTNIDEMDINTEIDWEIVHKKIDGMKALSLDYLKKVEGDYEL